jgi:hypothetical protein
MVLATMLSNGCRAQTREASGYQKTVEKQCRVQNKQSGYVLRPQHASARNNNAIVLFKDIDWACVTWDFIKGGNNTHALVNHYTGKSLKPSVDKPDNGTSVVQMPYDKTDNALLWEFIQLENGYYKIKYPNTELYMTSEDEEGEAGSRIVLNEWGNKPWQMWQLIQKPGK